MKDGEADATYGDHAALEAHEQDLIISYSAVKSGLQLDDAIYRANVDGNSASGEGCIEETSGSVREYGRVPRSKLE